MLKGKKIIALLLSVLILVSTVPVTPATAVELSHTLDVTLDADNLAAGVSNFELWTKTVEVDGDQTVGKNTLGDISEVTVSNGNLMIPKSFTATDGTVTNPASGMTVDKEINYLTLSADQLRDANGNPRSVESIEVSFVGTSAFSRQNGIVIGLYEENGYILGSGFFGARQMYPHVYTPTHSLKLNNNWSGNSNIFNSSWYLSSDTAADTVNVVSKVLLTYKFTYIYTGDVVTSIRWDASASYTEDPNAELWWASNATETRTKYAAKTGTITVNGANTLSHNNTNFVSNGTAYGRADTLTWNAANCVPVIVSGDYDSAATFHSVKYTLTKTQAEYDREAAALIPQQVNAAYNAFAADKTLANADSFIRNYNELPSGNVENHRDQLSAVVSWLKTQYGVPGKLTYTAEDIAELESYPDLKTFMEADNFNNLFDARRVETATAVVDLAQFFASGTGTKNVIMMNDLGDQSQGIQVGLNNNQYRIYATKNNVSKCPAEPTAGTLYKSDNGYGKDTYDTEVAYDSANHKYLAVSYTVRYAEPSENSNFVAGRTALFFKWKIWVDDDKDGVFDEGETLVHELTKRWRLPEDAWDWNYLVYTYGADGQPLDFKFGGLSDKAKSALVSLTLINQEDLDAGAALSAITAAQQDFQNNPGLASADAFLAAYSDLEEGKKPDYATTAASVDSWLTEAYADTDGEFTYTAAEFADYPAVQAWISADHFSNVFDGSLVQSAVAVLDKAKLEDILTAKGNGTYIDLLGINDLQLYARGNASSVSATPVVNGFMLRVARVKDAKTDRTALVMYNTVGDAGTYSSTNTVWDHAKSGNSYGKLDWYTAYQYYQTGTSGALQYDFTGASKDAEVAAYNAATYVAMSYTVNYEDVPAKGYTKCRFHVRLWVDDGDGVYEENEVILSEDNKLTHVEQLLYKYKDGEPREFTFGGVGESAMPALVSLTLRNDFVADYSEVYTDPSIDKVYISDIIAMNKDLQTVYHSFITDDIRAKAEAAYASILPTGAGASVKISANQNLGFYALRPACFGKAGLNTESEIYQANLDAFKSFGAVFQTYNTMKASHPGAALTLENAAGSIAATQADGTLEVTETELLFELSNVNISSADNWDKWIVTRFYVTYGTETVYSEVKGTNPAGSEDGFDATGCTVRSVNGVLKSILSAVESAAAATACDTVLGKAYKNADGQTVDIYKDRPFSEVKSNLSFGTALDACYFLMAYQDVVAAVAQ